MIFHQLFIQFGVLELKVFFLDLEGLDFLGEVVEFGVEFVGLFLLLLEALGDGLVGCGEVLVFFLCFVEELQ